MALTQTQVSQLYVSIFGRASEGEGNSYWQQDQDSMVAAAAVMLDTDPAKDYFGETLDDNQAFIKHIYLNTLGKTAEDDPDGIGYWVAQLDEGTSKADVIVALINAAQDPDNAGAAQDQFNNKVLVSNYTADTIAKFTDIATFTAYISGVDDSPESVAAAKENVDADVPEIIVPEIEGDTIRLTANEDRGEDGTGTADNDTFDGGLGGNIMGQSTNTWQSFDRLDGLGGRDKMDAELIMSVNHFSNPSPLEAKTQNIEEFYINARESGTSSKFSLSLEDINIGGTSVKSLIPEGFIGDMTEGLLPGGIFPIGFEMKQASSDVVQVAGREILDWDYIESFYSDADLVVYGLTTNKSDGGTTKLSDMTISMDHTSGSTANTQSLLQGRSFNEWGAEHFHDEHYHEKLGYGHYINGALEASSMKVLFEQNYLTTTTRTEGSALYIELMDMDEALGGGEWVGTGLPLEDNPYGKITFTMNGVVKTLDYGTGSDTYAGLLADIQAAITAAAVTDPDFAKLSASFGNRFTATDTDTQPGGSTQGTTIVITNSGPEVLEAKGMFATGEQPAGKDFHTNFYNQAPGTDVLPIIIDIELEKVGRGEDGGGLIVGGDNYTKGFDQFDVYVKGVKNKTVDQSSSVAYLLTTPHDGLDTINIYTHEDFKDNPADLTIGNSNTPVYSILDVNHLDATDFLGNLSIYNAVIQAPGNYLYELSGQDDTLQMYVTNDALNTTNSSLVIDGGAGDNTIHVDYSYSNGSVGVNTDIITESGDDVVVLSNMGLEFRGNFNWWAPEGSGDDDDQDGSGDQGNLLIVRADSARIETGAGNDAIFLNSHLDFCSPDAALWHTLNWTGTGAEEYFTSIGLTNLPPWTTDPGDTEANWAPAGNVFPVFGSSLRVTFAGVESDWVTIDTNKDYKTTKAELVAAMAKAIESDVNLNHVLKVDTDAVTGGISIQSLTGGAFGRGDLFVDVEGPLPYLGDVDFGAGYTPDASIFDPYFPGTNDVNQVSAQGLVAAWNAYYPGSNVKYNAALKTITNMDGSGTGDFSSDDNSGWFDADLNGTVANLNEFLQAVQQNAETTENMINAALWNQAWPANHQLDNQGSPASAGVQYVNAGSGHDTIVLPSGGITTVEFTGKFDTTTIISDNNIANLRFDFSSYLDSVAAGRGASVNPLLDLNLVNSNTVMDGFCPVPTVALNEFDGVENATDWNAVDGGGGQHNSITYFDFSDLWLGLQTAYNDLNDRGTSLNRDLLEDRPELPSDSFASFDAQDLESALNLWLADGDFGWNGTIRQPEDYFDRNLNQGLGFDNGGLEDVLGAEFVILVGKDGEVVQNYHDGGADYADPYVNWSIDNGYANGEVKVFTGEIGRTMLAGDQAYTYHFDNVELQGVINLGVADVNNAENRAFNWADNGPADILFGVGV